MRQIAYEDKDDFYNHSWLLLQELISFDWNIAYYCEQFEEYRNIQVTCSHFIQDTIPKLLQLGAPKGCADCFFGLVNYQC
ncbi:hypothetical protein DCC85_13905 [Paenibacillus sp. CAA11]|uniref:hypothetical protein n=1 Tax=Paenibacillus sp. CAA11 TaxID=1532905 RepID=UPI000D35E0BA|nr:hypothetical protein [Paenibacillus sp. CAA11]AWB45215.1 hypothetical protein DCC85_13905 [Paenibacillus sp. CAA11]